MRMDSSARLSSSTCPGCTSTKITVFYEVQNVPVHSVLLLPARQEALNYPRGDIVLGFCQTCGFIYNLAFKPDLLKYSSKYDPTQAYSSTFNTFHRNLADRLIEQHDLHGKNIVEIGCGQGEFLKLLCESTGNHGIGFDPAYVGESDETETDDRITFIQDFYSEKYSNVPADFICCKMTLEHIKDTAHFVSTIRRSIGHRSDVTVFFQVPNVVRILRELAFWDIYYEHCSYFSPGSLARLFRKCGFDVINVGQVYDDQYVTIEAKPGLGQGRVRLDQEDDIERLRQDVSHFAKEYPLKLKGWQRDLEKIRENGQQAIIWGGGSKGVAFLTTLNIQKEIEYVVDINPHKDGMYIAGTGQQIVSPEFLRTYSPDIVIVMNPVYCNEIEQELNRLGLKTQLMPAA